MRVSRTIVLSRTLAVAFLAVLIGAGAACTQHEPATETGTPTVALEGTVLFSNGQPPAVAHVVLETLDGTNPEVLGVGKNGVFHADVLAGATLQLRAAAPDHEEVTVPVYLAPDSPPAKVTITLAPNPRPDTFESVLIIGDFNKFQFSSAEPMTRRDDGTWVWKHDGIEGDRFAYQLLGITANGHSVNGTMSDELVYDGGGDFQSVVHPHDGSVEIVFDPSKLPPVSEASLPAVRWDEHHADLAALFDVLRVQDAAQVAMSEAWQRHKEENGSVEGFEYDWTPWAEKLQQAAGENPSTLSQQVAYLLAESMGNQWPQKPDPEAARALLETVPADSPAWGFAPQPLQRLFALAGEGDAGTAIAQQFLDGSPVASVRHQALAALTAIARDAGDEATWRARFEKLKEAVGDSRQWKYQLASLDPDKKIRKGNPVPEFAVTLLDGSTFSNEDLEGHYTLIDFWATWCGPCVGEMPHLHEAWKKFHGDGFQILSISLDRSKDDIAKFRTKWPMPWKHAFVEKGFSDGVVKTFEVMGIPTPVLVGPDGTIVATEPETRGDQLIATLDGLYSK